MAIKIPYDYQQEAIDSVFKFFQENKTGNPLIVAPTGSGKSLLIAEMIRLIRRKWADQKILVLAHDASILEQNFKAIEIQNPNMKVGLYSSSLGSKTIKNVTVAGIQSVYKKPELFKKFNLIFLDEAHMLAPNKKSRYRLFFNALNKRVVGLTATPFRLGSGYLHTGEDAFFSDIVYSIPMKKLQEAGRLCQVINKQPSAKMDASAIKKQAGDFIIKELSMAFDREAITEEIVNDLVRYKELRKKWLVYAIDIEHCEHIAETMNKFGIKTAVLHSKMKSSRESILNDFRAGEYQAVVSVAMLTTGLDIPEVDMLVLLRPTSSPVLHIQIIGRGMRVSPEKENCLVLDYAGNLLRNGPVDAPIVETPKGKGGGDPIMKVCENCEEIVHIAVRICPSCGAEFHFQHHLSLSPAEEALLSSTDWHKVNDVDYTVYIGKKDIPMLRVTYQCGLRRFNEHVCLEHDGYAKAKAHQWWTRRTNVPFPPTALEAIKHIDGLKRPQEILVEDVGKYPTIKAQIFE